MKNHYIHKEYPKTCDPKDFFGQIKRTVNGKPVSQEQISMIVSSIRANLKLQKNDSLLDIGCGNGALSQYFFKECGHFLGIDFSKYLLQIAKENFEQPPTHIFKESDALTYVKSEISPLQFNKALCYGCFSYLSFQEAEQFLVTLRQRFQNLKLLFIGNLPNKDHASKFYKNKESYQKELNDNQSPIGIWRNMDEMKHLAKKSGWDIDFKFMPKDFYASHYRYDALLTPSKKKI